MPSCLQSGFLWIKYGWMLSTNLAAQTELVSCWPASAPASHPHEEDRENKAGLGLCFERVCRDKSPGQNGLFLYFISLFLKLKSWCSMLNQSLHRSPGGLPVTSLSHHCGFSRWVDLVPRTIVSPLGESKEPTDSRALCSFLSSKGAPQNDPFPC